MKLLIMQSFPVSCYSLHLSPESLPQHPFLSRTPSACVLPLMSETRFHTHTKSCEVPLLVFFSLTVNRQGINPGNEFTPMSGAINSKPFRILAHFLQQRCGPTRPAVHSTSCRWCARLVREQPSVRPPRTHVAC